MTLTCDDPRHVLEWWANIAVWLKNGQRVVEGTELESDQQELHSDFIASQRKGTHKI